MSPTSPSQAPKTGPSGAVTEGVTPATTSAATTERGRYEFLDAVRGLAALAVALQHGAEALGLAPDGSRAWLNLGEIGVVAFFLVSGFIIPRSLERYGSVSRFWWGRAFRLYPAYWLSLLGAVAMIAAGVLQSPFAGMRHPALGVLVNVTMLQGFLRLPPALGVYWTLALELLFYALTSVLFVLGALRRPGRCLAVAVLLYGLANLLAAALGRSLPAGLLGLLVSAFAGTLALRSLSDAGARRALRRLALPLAAMLSLGLSLRFARFPVAHQVQAPTATAVILSWVLGYALFFGLFALRHRQFPRGLLWLGRISYSFYLWHVPVFVAMPMLGHRWMSLLLDLAVTALVADLSFRLVERPALRLGGRWLQAHRS